MRSYSLVVYIHYGIYNDKAKKIRKDYTSEEKEKEKIEEYKRLYVAKRTNFFFFAQCNLRECLIAHRCFFFFFFVEENCCASE